MVLVRMIMGNNTISTEQPSQQQKRTLQEADGDAVAKRQRLNSLSNTDEAQCDDTGLLDGAARNAGGFGEQIVGGDDKPLSKSQQKKLRKRQQWEDGRDARKLKRKQKLIEKRERKRADANVTPQENKPRHRPRPIQLPLTIVVDCQFEQYMTETELISMQGQLTRCYSDNRHAVYRAHLCVSSFGGKLKQRFEGLMANMHLNWQGVKFLDADCVEACDQAKKWMKEEPGQRIAGALERRSKAGADATGDGFSNGSLDSMDKPNRADSPPEPACEGEIIYLTSDSPDTLEELKPHSTYIIGGIVDKNRHKGLCYKIAKQNGIKTAKLPIGEYLKMQSRTVLTTNHVNEIMLKWLELGDWGQAFMAVIPKRKEASLKGDEEELSSAKAGCETGEDMSACNETPESATVEGDVKHAEFQSI